MRGRNSIAKISSMLVMAFLLALEGGRQPTRGAEPDFALVVRNEEGKETKMGMMDIAKLPRTSSRAKDEKGKESVWEGPTLYEVLKAAGVKFGEEIRGKALANYLLVEAADGYRVVLALPELDAAFTDLLFLLADRRDGRPMDENEGKLRIIVPHEKRHARWVRRVVALSIQHP